MNDTTTPQRPKLGDIFESITCSRCGGEGRLFVYSNVQGGTCFKCNGAKRTFTDRGQRDLAAYRAAVDAVTLKPVTAVKPGDAVRSDNMKKYVPVVAISEPRISSWSWPTESAGPQPKDAIFPTHEDPKGWTVHYSVDITLDREVWHDLSCPLTYKGATFTIGTDDQIRIYPGAESMPKAESFDSRRAAGRAA